MFEIIIKRIETKSVPARYYREAASTGGGDTAKKDGGPKYDYVWENEEKAVEHVIYTQKVESLNLADIVAVVNEIPPRQETRVVLDPSILMPRSGHEVPR